jgi:xylulokinase
MPLVLGVDSSTQSTKVVVCDADDGRVVASGRASHPATAPPRSEQHPSAWWDALVAAVHATGVRDIAALAVAGQQHGLVALDSNGEPLRPAKLWNDTESAPEATDMVERLGAAQWASRTGSVPVAAFTITKLAWLFRHEPAVAARLSRVLLPHDYLTYRLTGRVVTDRGDASGTGYWSPFDERWLPDLLDTVVDGAGPSAWDARLPDVLAPTEAAERTTREARDVLGFDGAPVVGPGTGDNMAGALGIGLREGDLALSLGTSGTVYTVHAAPVADPSGAVAGFADAGGRFLPLVCTLNATLVTEAAARLLGVDHRALDALALAEPPGSGGLVLVPYLSGERTPNRPDATGLVAGLRADVRREQLARAAFEGVACGLLDGVDALRAVGAASAANRIALVGGGARSSAYQRVVADLSGLPVVLSAADEQVAVGAAVQAAAVLHGRTPDDVAAAWQVGHGTVVEPDERVDREAIRATYRAAADR